MVAAVVAALGPGAAAASAAGGVAVTINGRAGLRLSLEDLQQHVDIARMPATVRSADGTERTELHGGVSARDLVEKLIGIPAATVRRLELPRTSLPGSVVLTGDEVADGFGGDLHGRLAATFDPDYGPEVHFFRPLRDEQDVNDRDAVDAPSGSDLRVVLETTGRALDVSAIADDTTLGSGAPVRLNALTSGVPDGVQLRFQWSFGDGQSAAGASVSHAYAVDGTYDATVTVVGSDGSSGISAPVRIIVGAGGDGGAAATPQAPSGPATSGSGGNGAGGGTSATGTGTGAQGPTTGRRSGSATRTSRPKSTRSRRPSSRPSTSTGTRAPVPAASTAGQPATSSTTTAPTAPRRSAPKSVAPTSERVRGTVVAGTGSPLSGALAAADALARLPDEQVAGARAGAGHTGPAGWMGGGTIALALLAAGALREGLRTSRLRPSA